MYFVCLSTYLLDRQEARTTDMGEDKLMDGSCTLEFG